MGKYFEITKMGESVVEATLTKWLKEEGESIGGGRYFSGDRYGQGRF